MKYVLSIIIGCIFFQGFSQDYFDLVNLTYASTPPNDFETSNEQTRIEELALELNLPIIINDKTILLTGLFANNTKVNLDANMPGSNLKVFGLNYGVNTTFNDRWSATFMVFSKIAADNIKISKDNLQHGFLSLFTKKNRDDLKYRYGMYANTEKYGLIIVPIFGLYYISENKRFEADLNLPIVGDMNYKINQKLWLGMKFDGLGTTYNLNEQNYDISGAYVSKTSNELVGYLRFKLGKSLYLNTKMGYAISRKYEVYHTNDKVDLALTSIYFGDDRTQLNEDFKDGAIFQAQLFYRFYFD